MPNNFRLTGDYYVSKEGSDGNSGLTPDLPKLTVQAGLNLMTTTGKRLIIGSGVYKETITHTTTITITGTIQADGKVILQGSGADDFYLLNAATGVIVNWSIYDIEFSNYNKVKFGQSVNGLANSTYSFYRCVFKSDTLFTIFNSSTVFVISFNYCQFINNDNSLVSNSGLISTINLLNCIAINSVFYYNSLQQSIFGYLTNYKVSTMKDCYVDSYSIIHTYSAISAANFNFNNIQGKIIMNTGTYSGIALSFADHRTYYPTFNVNSMSVAPLFNDVQNLNFTLQSGSPHIRAASDYISNIGGTEYAVYKAVTDAVFSGGTISNLTLNGIAYTITAGTSGYVITTPIAVQSFPATKPLTGILLHGDLQFNKSITAPAQGNQNVPAYDTYTSGGGATPDRLKIKMRYSTQSASPTAGQWNNGGYWAVDTYQLVEVNVKPKVDSNGIGNGDYTYLEFSGLGDLVPTWIQLDIKLRNDYQI